MLTWTSAAVTDVGTRRKINEDSMLELPRMGLWVVADGMGGHAAGDYASQKITTDFKTLEIRNRPLPDIIDDMEDRLLAINQHLLTYARERNVPVVGSTMVALLLTERVGVCMWIGDSRLYRCHEQQISRISSDHSLVQAMVDQGTLREDEAQDHPSRNVITRAVGADLHIYPEIRVFKPAPGDGFLLCTDGLYGEVHEMDILDLIIGLNAKDAAESLLDVALHDGADDNVTLIVIKIRD